MKTEIQNLENKINELVMRMNNAEETLTTNATNEINSMRSELEKLINEFDLLKIKLLKENSDVKITDEDIEDIISLIDEYINDYSTSSFCGASFNTSDINNVELSLNYDCEVLLQSAEIDVSDYFCQHFIFDYDEFIQMLRDSNKDDMIKFIPIELFNLISNVIHQSVSDFITSIDFDSFGSFECEMDSYKRIEVTEIFIETDTFVNIFKDNHDYDAKDIEELFINYYNLKSEENSEENNSEE